jgi:adenylate cyclase
VLADYDSQEIRKTSAPASGSPMALFIPGICGANYKRLAAEAAVALLDAVGYRAGAKVWMPMGVAVNSGLSYVGNVGTSRAILATAWRSIGAAVRFDDGRAAET